MFSLWKSKSLSPVLLLSLAFGVAVQNKIMAYNGKCTWNFTLPINFGKRKRHDKPQRCKLMSYIHESPLYNKKKKVIKLDAIKFIKKIQIWVGTR